MEQWNSPFIAHPTNFKLIIELYYILGCLVQFTVTNTYLKDWFTMLIMVNIRTKQLHLVQAWSRNSKGTTAGSKYRMKPERVNLTKQIFRNGKCQSQINSAQHVLLKFALLLARCLTCTLALARILTQECKPTLFFLTFQKLSIQCLIIYCSINYKLSVLIVLF